MKNIFKIIQYTHQFRPIFGGLETHVELLANNLIEQGYPTVVVTPRRDRGWKRHDAVGPVRIERITSLNTKRLQGITESICAVYRVRKETPAIIHCHGKSRASQMILRYFKIFHKNIGLILTVHSDSGIPDIKTRKDRFALHSYSFAHRIIAVNHELQKKIIQLGIPRNKVVTLHNPVDTSLFRPLNPRDRDVFRQKMGLKNKKVVLYAGRLAKEKGTDILCSIWGKYQALRQNATLLVIGDGPLRRLIEELEKNTGRGSVLYKGYQSNVALFMQIADVLLLPSRREGLPCVVVEAASSGLPVIATSTTGALETIDHGKTGLILNSEEPEEAVSVLDHLLSDDAFRIGLGRNARKKALKLWNIKAYLRSLISLYQETFPA